MGDRVGGLVKSNTDCLLHRPRRSQKAVAKLLNSISLSNQALNRNSKNTRPSFLEDLINLNRLSRNRYRIYLISDFRGELSHWEEAISRISRSNLVSCIHITDPLENKLPQSGYYSVTDGINRFSSLRGTKRTLQDYQNRFDQRCNRIADICAKRAVRYKKIETGEENFRFSKALLMQTDPLQQLKPLHLPPDPSWWPPAIGWWVLLLVLVILAAWILYRLTKFFGRCGQFVMANTS